MTSAEHLELPTNRTVSGPKCSGLAQQLIVEYDYEHDSGAIEWTIITFNEVLEFRYRQAACCSADDIQDSHQMGCTTSSAFLREVTSKWKESVGWQDWHQKQGGNIRFSHYKLYFDDAGCLDVVASSYSISSK